MLGNETIYCLSVLNREIRVKTENDIFDIGRTLRISVLEKIYIILIKMEKE
ncbi:hypothetical protein KK423_03295 [Clostridioides difficile]|nr:hypothetical protein [Clostridioides difficile]